VAEQVVILYQNSPNRGRHYIW